MQDSSHEIWLPFYCGSFVLWNIEAKYGHLYRDRLGLGLGPGIREIGVTLYWVLTLS